MTTETYMTIREMCDLFDVTPRTLRFYEAKELLFPLRRGTRRLFTRSDRARLKLILKGKRFGFSLEEIRQVLDLYNPESNSAQLKMAFELGQQHLAALEARRNELDEIIDDLKAQLDIGRDWIQSAKHKTAAE